MMLKKTLSDIAGLCNEQSSTEGHNKIIANCVQLYNEKKLKVLDIVEALEPCLNHEGHGSIAIGIGFLADILHELPKDTLEEKELFFLVRFYVGHLGGHHSAIPKVLSAFFALLKYDNLTSNDVQNCLKGIFLNVECQSQVSSDRRTIYNIFQYCVLNKFSVLREMGESFISGMISCMGGEKDPMNLLLLFTIFPSVAANIELGLYEEEMFEVVAAYFPIDYVPPENDPYCVSAQDLVLKLRDCLSCNPKFAPYCMPLLKEKIDSDIVSAKIDALETYAVCCNVYYPKDINMHLLTFYDSIRREIFNSVTPETHSFAIAAVGAMLSNQVLGDTSRQVVMSALEECLGHLSTPEQKLMYPSSQLLLAICETSETSATSVVTEVIPLLCKQYDVKTDDYPRKNTLLALSKFIKCCAKHANLIKSGGIIITQKELWWKVFLCSISEESNATIQEAALLSLTNITPILDNEQLQILSTRLTTLLLHSSNALRTAVVCCITAIGTDHPGIVQHSILPFVMDKLSRENNSDNCFDVEVLSLITINFTIDTQLITFMWNNLHQNFHSNYDYSLKCIKSINKVFSQMKNCIELDHYIINDIRMESLVMLTLSCLSHITDADKLITVLSSLSALFRTITVAFKEVPIHKLSSLIQMTLELANGEEVQSIDDSYVTSVNEVSQYLSQNKKRRIYLVYLIEGLVTCIPGEPTYDVVNLIEILSEWGLSDDARCSTVASMTLASIINKLSAEQNLLVNSIRDKLSPVISSSDSVQRHSSLSIWAWICKALVMSGSPLSSSFTDLLKQLLSDKDIGQAAASSFQLIMKDHDYILTTYSGANIRFLYRQRFFESHLPFLISSFEEENPIVHNNALFALTSMLPFLPSQVLQSHIKKLLPLLLQGLKLSQIDIIEETVNTLSILLEHSPNDAAHHINSFVQNLLKLTNNNPLKIRVRSCECLGHLSAVDTTAILPYKQDVINGLKLALNDRKRVVRTAAATTRSSWVLVGAP